MGMGIRNSHSLEQQLFHWAAVEDYHNGSWLFGGCTLKQQLPSLAIHYPHIVGEQFAYIRFDVAHSLITLYKSIRDLENDTGEILHLAVSVHTKVK